MQFVDFFLGVSWVSFVAIIWFCTDWFSHYSQLFGVFEATRLRYTSFILGGEKRYFPEFLYSISLDTTNRVCKFGLKLLSCPFCLLAWLSIAAGTLLQSWWLIAPIYVTSLIILLHIKGKM